MKRKENTIAPHTVYVVEGEKEKYWTKIGVAFPHQDGNGFNLKLSCFPLIGKLVIRGPKTDDDEAGQ